MNNIKLTYNEIFDNLITTYPALSICSKSIMDAFDLLRESYKLGGKLLVAGNGGSAADSEHIVGILMKSFNYSREIDCDFFQQMTLQYGEDGKNLADKLQGALPAIPLTSMPALTSAFANDVDSAVSFAQMLYAYANNNDVFLGISTSGNSKNIKYALMTAKAKGIKTILLSGKTGGECKALSDISICVPTNITYEIQEYHLPIYHAIAAMLEAYFFNGK